MNIEKEILQSYIPFVSFLAEVMGDDCEVVLHDITSPENSVIAIKNNNLSGRTLGAPMTDFAIEKLMPQSGKSFFVNYKGRAKSGATLRSSTFFIKHDGKSIGMVCINCDIEKFLKVQEIISHVTAFEDETQKPEIFSNNAEELLHTLLDEAVRSSIIEPNRMNSDEKIEFLRKLENNGFFMVKGAIPEAAKSLKVSEASIYRYLKTIKQ